MRNNKKGFTLAELLVVVAIIGVLVAISIPVFNGQLDKAKKAKDIANIRSGIAAANAEYLNGTDRENLEKEMYCYIPGKGKLIYVKSEWYNKIQPVVEVGKEKLYACLIIIDSDDENDPIKTYPYVDENGDITYDKGKIGSSKEKNYYTVYLKDALLKAKRNHFE